MRYLFAPRLPLDRFVAMRRFTAFDGVRALAAVMVIVHHFSGTALTFLSGWLGVHLFFVLSGFLITTLLVREEADTGRISLGDFWIRRLLRILPAYYVVLLVTVGLVVALNRGTEEGVRESIGWFLTVNPDLAPTSMSFYPAWTIGVEQKFYLIWPVLAFVAVAHAGRRRFAVWAVAVVILAVVAVFVNAFFVHYVVILLGCGIALAMHSPRIYPVISVFTARLPGVAILLVLVGVQLAAAPLHDLLDTDVPAILAYGICAALALPGLVASERVAPVLAWRPLAWLGERSYSIYLVQVLAWAVVTAVIPSREGAFYLAPTLVVAILMADVLHRWVELPGIGLARRLTHERKARRTVPPVTRLELEEQEAGVAPPAPEATRGPRHPDSL